MRARQTYVHPSVFLFDIAELFPPLLFLLAEKKREWEKEKTFTFVVDRIGFLSIATEFFFFFGIFVLKEAVSQLPPETEKTKKRAGECRICVVYGTSVSRGGVVGSLSLHLPYLTCIPDTRTAIPPGSHVLETES